MKIVIELEYGFQNLLWDFPGSPSELVKAWEEDKIPYPYCCEDDDDFEGEVWGASLDVSGRNHETIKECIRLYAKDLIDAEISLREDNERERLRIGKDVYYR